MSPQEAEQTLSNILADLLAGKVVFSLTMVPALVGAAKTVQGDGWISSGLARWTAQDPQASGKLATILTKAGASAPVPFKAAIMRWIQTDPNAMLVLLAALQESGMLDGLGAEQAPEPGTDDNPIQATAERIPS